jgi:prophage regulatory protein
MSLPKVLRLPEVMLITSLSKSTVYAWMEAGSFPESKELGRNSVGWYEKDIQPTYDAFVICRGGAFDEIKKEFRDLAVRTERKTGQPRGLSRSLVRHWH